MRGKKDLQLAVIGTAGRQDDARRITRKLYDAMYEATLSAMRDWGVRRLVSGGAAVADHLAVRSFLDGEASALTLYLPSDFDVANGRYHGNGDADIANRYHERFSLSCGVDSLSEMAAAARRGAELIPGRGFKSRNLDVAENATHVLALTFGPLVDDDSERADFLPEDEGFSSAKAAHLKSGGTAHTWNECWRAKRKRHVNLTFVERRVMAAELLAQRGPGS